MRRLIQKIISYRKVLFRFRSESVLVLNLLVMFSDDIRCLIKNYNRQKQVFYNGCFKLHLPWCSAVTAWFSVQFSSMFDFFHADGPAAGHSLSWIRLDLLDQDWPAGSCHQTRWVQIQRGCPSSPAFAARASFCWIWYSWNLMEIRWVIFRYFCRQDSEQLDWKTKHKRI